MVFSRWISIVLVLVAHVVASHPTRSRAAETPLKRVAVVCPPEWREELAEWKTHRAAQGYVVLDVDPLADPAALRAVLAKLHADVPLDAVLLIGDASSAGATGQRAVNGGVPTFYEPARVLPRFGGEAEIATDFSYADPDGDGIPETAVGRWPARNAAQVRTVVAKTLAYERSRDFGMWRGRINLVAGAGGFGPLVDAAIEQSARTILLSGLPAGYHPTLTFGSWTSPHCPDPRRFADEARARMEEGCLFWVYIGHGHAGGLDRVRMPDRSQFEILQCRDCADLTPSRTAPIALFLACSTGAFDRVEPCLAEELLLSPGGPVAVVAGSRMTMPYGLGIFADEALTAGLRERGETLGGVLRTAKARTLDPTRSEHPSAVRQMLDPVAGLLTPGKHDAAGELREHTRLMNLFGDPCLRLALPRPIEVTVPEHARPGETITVSTSAENPIAAGTHVRWDLRFPSTRVATVTAKRERYAADETVWSELQQTYLESLRPELVSVVGTTGGEIPSARLEIPRSASGEYEIRLWLDDAAGARIGCAKIRVDKLR